MVIFVNAAGQAKVIKYSTITQGSRKANSITLVAPFPSTTSVIVNAKLPNGMILKSDLFLPVGDGGSLSELGFDDKLNVWSYDIDATLTQYDGTLQLTFCFVFYDETALNVTVGIEITESSPYSVYTDANPEALAGWVTRAEAAANSAEESKNAAKDAELQAQVYKLMAEDAANEVVEEAATTIAAERDEIVKEGLKALDAAAEDLAEEAAKEAAKEASQGVVYSLSEYATRAEEAATNAEKYKSSALNSVTQVNGAEIRVKTAQAAAEEAQAAAEAAQAAAEAAKADILAKNYLTQGADGSVHITGDLIVDGESIAIDTEVVRSENAIMIVNSEVGKKDPMDGYEPTSGYSGMLIAKKSIEDTNSFAHDGFAVVYDYADKRLKAGAGVNELNKDGSVKTSFDPWTKLGFLPIAYPNGNVILFNIINSDALGFLGKKASDPSTHEIKANEDGLAYIINVSEKAILLGSSQAVADYAIAAGLNNIAFDYGSLALGCNTFSGGRWSVSTGSGTSAIGAAALSGGDNTKAIGNHSISWGKDAKSVGDNSLAVGYTNSSSGYEHTAYGDYSAVLGRHCKTGDASIADSGQCSLATGSNAESLGKFAVSTGLNTRVYANSGHASGEKAVSGTCAYELTGYSDYYYEYKFKLKLDASITSTTDANSALESMFENVSECLIVNSNGRVIYSDINSKSITVYNSQELSDGYVRVAVDPSKYVKGKEFGSKGRVIFLNSSEPINVSDKRFGPLYYGKYSFAHGLSTAALAETSVAMGKNTVAVNPGQAVFGLYNEIDTETLFVVGNGTDSAKRSNAFAVKANGRAVIGAAPEEDMDVVNKKYLDDIVGNISLLLDELHTFAESYSGGDS